MYINLCGNFTLSGNQDQLIIVVENGDKKQGLIVNNPRIGLFQTRIDTLPVHTMGGVTKYIKGGPTEVEFNIVGYDPELEDRDEILKMYDPILQKSVLELLAAINKKLNLRDDK